MIRRQRGYLIETGEGPKREADSFTCGHCQHVVFVKPRCDAADMGGRCTCCDKLICPGCVGKGCDPFEEKLQRMEALRSYGL